MYIFKNAFKSIVRAKGRNLLIGLIVLVLSVSSCIGLSIKRANTTLKTQYAEDHEITATLTSTERGKAMEGIPLKTLQSYGENDLVKSFGYSAALYFSASDGIEPLDVSGSFGQNKDFRDKYGDIENGEKVTSSTSSSTTSTEEDTAATGTIINLSTTDTSGYVMKLTNTQGNDGTETIESNDGESENQSDITSSNAVSSESTSSESASSDSASSHQTASKDTPSEEASSESSSKPKDSESSRNSDTSTPAQNDSQNMRPTLPNQSDDRYQKGETTTSAPSPEFTPDGGTVSSPQGGTVQKAPDEETSSDKSASNKNNQNGNSANALQPPQASDGENEGEKPTPGGFRGDTFITNHHITNNQFFFNMASMNDFTVVGYNSTDAIPEYVRNLDVLNIDDSARNCIISKSLAEENDMKIGDTFKLANPNNDEEIYKFTIVGICDTSESTDSADTSSNASFTDNYIHVSAAAIDKIVAASEKENKTDDEEESSALAPIYSGTFSFKNLTDYNSMNELVAEDSYSLVSEDVSNYEQSIQQLETLGGYATYFLIVIFIIGAIVLVIINLFSIRDRKYEIGVLTAIGMKKRKVATQFVIELFCITFLALIIGSGIGAVSSVPVTNGLLTTINSTDAAEVEEAPSNAGIDGSLEKGDAPDLGEENAPPDMPNPNGGKGMGDRFRGFMQNTNNYIASVTSATDLTVIGQMILVGLGLTLISALSAVLFVMRYEPLKILSNRE